MRLILSARAIADLASINDHISQDSPSAAGRMSASILAACDQLILFPGMGRRGVTRETRELVTVRPYVIVYKTGDGVVEIVNIWHSAQDR